VNDMSKICWVHKEGKTEWTENRGAKWYVILWRLLWFIPFLGCLTLASICALLSHGRRGFKRVWEVL